ncbi:hypothetical protein ACFPN7_15625 [Amycolatopsis halotolerans]
MRAAGTARDHGRVEWCRCRIDTAATETGGDRGQEAPPPDPAAVQG